jgi:sulfur-carrier protein
MIRVILPYHLRTLARIEDAEVQLDVPAPVTLSKALDAVETHYPVLRGTLRDHGTLHRRPFIRFFVCREDWSHEPLEKELPDAIVNGQEPLMVIGAIAGG